MVQPTLKPSVSIQPMDELLSVAMAMEKESVEGYADLAECMRVAGRPDQAEVFDRLMREECGHSEMVADWSRQVCHQTPEIQPAQIVPLGVFDAEGVGQIAPELVNAYHSLAVAMRNEEGAFVFWSHAAEHGMSPEIRNMAEQMAREKLEHAKILRRERHKVFLRHRRQDLAVCEPYDLPALELEVSKALEKCAGMGENQGEYRDLALEARKLSHDLMSDPLQDLVPAGPPAPQSLDPLCEWLADYYVESGEHLLSQAARDRAQALADIAVRRLAIVRHLEAKRR